MARNGASSKNTQENVFAYDPGMIVTMDKRGVPDSYRRGPIRFVVATHKESGVFVQETSREVYVSDDIRDLEYKVHEPTARAIAIKLYGYSRKSSTVLTPQNLRPR